MVIRYTNDLDAVDWKLLKATLSTDKFDNGRSANQLAESFVNSFAVCFSWHGTEIVGTARVLSDGVCNSYLVDVWTRSDLRGRGIATTMIDSLTNHLHGQHVYLQAETENVEFYRRIGFAEQPKGMSRIVGTWLNDGATPARSSPVE